MMTPSITEDAVIELLQAFVVDVTGIAAAKVIRAPNNRTPMPKGEFIALTSLLNSALSTNVKGPIVSETQTTTRNSMFTIQVDIYGADAGNKAEALATMLRDSYGADFFDSRNPAVAPLYASDARMIPLVAGEAQYIDRWTLEAVLQFNPSVVTPQESAARLSIDNFFPLP